MWSDCQAYYYLSGTPKALPPLLKLSPHLYSDAMCVCGGGLNEVYDTALEDAKYIKAALPAFSNLLSKVS